MTSIVLCSPPAPPQWEILPLEKNFWFNILARTNMTMYWVFPTTWWSAGTGINFVLVARTRKQLTCWDVLLFIRYLHFTITASHIYLNKAVHFVSYDQDSWSQSPTTYYCLNYRGFTRHEKSGVWFLKHCFQDSEGSSKWAGDFTKTHVKLLN